MDSRNRLTVMDVFMGFLAVSFMVAILIFANMSPKQSSALGERVSSFAGLTNS